MSVNQNESVKNNDERLHKHVPSLVLFVTLAFAFTVAGVYIFDFGHVERSADPARWGQFGDYISGLLNPVVATGALVLLFISVQIQRRELRSTRQALENQVDLLKRQETESMFFRLLGLRDEVISSFSYGGSAHSIGNDQNQITFSGQRALRELARNLSYTKLFVEVRENPSESPEQASKLSSIAEEYSGMFLSYALTIRSVLNHLDTIPQDASERFATIFRGLLTPSELLVLFVYGFHIPHFNAILDKYSVLSAINLESIGVQNGNLYDHLRSKVTAKLELQSFRESQISSEP